MKKNGIYFPENYCPNRSAVFARNEIFINASEEAIWHWLIRVTTWPEWYSNASNIKLIGQAEEHLLVNTTFKWRTFNTNINSKVTEFKPYERLAWEATGWGLKAYHGWLIIPQETGCKVITEESQNGLLPRLASYFITKGLLKQHQIWLEGLKLKSESFSHR